MDFRPGDTDETTYQVWVQALRSLTPEQRLLNALQLSEQSRELALAGIRLRHPEYSDEQAELALRRWRWGDSIFREVYPGAELLDP
ncbi:hypothetical protein JST97_31695 [bacterium]|nr:hypothetical protein [bacterium]